MSTAAQVKPCAQAAVEAQRGLLREISLALHERPETGGQEVFACDLLSRSLEAAGFDVEAGVAGLPTAFVVAFSADRNRQAPRIAFLAELHALPDIGHACGHNASAAASIGAAVALAKCRCEHHLPGTAMVFGTPAGRPLAGRSLWPVTATLRRSTRR